MRSADGRYGSIRRNSAGAIGHNPLDGTIEVFDQKRWDGQNRRDEGTRASGAQVILHHGHRRRAFFGALRLAKVSEAEPMVEDDGSKFPFVTMGYKFSAGSYAASGERGLGIHMGRRSIVIIVEGKKRSSPARTEPRF
jgi:hypothetical protein